MSISTAGPAARKGITASDKRSMDTFEVVRYSTCFELNADVARRRFGISLPPPPTGHVRNLFDHEASVRHR